MYFPNFVFTIVRPPANLPKDWAVFRVSPMLNKYDIRNYLEAIYKVKVLEVNTIKYLGKYRRDELGRTIRLPNWKKAYVRLDKPFHYPDPPNLK